MHRDPRLSDRQAIANLRPRELIAAEILPRLAKIARKMVAELQT